MTNGNERIPNTIAVVPPTPEDAENILKIIKDGYLDVLLNEKKDMPREEIERHIEEIFAEGTLEDWKAWIMGADHENFLAAKQNNSITGVLRWRELPQSNLLIHFFVKPGARGAGTGKKLLNAALRAMNPEKNVTLWVGAHNESARKFYEDFGFTPTGKDADEGWKTPHGTVTLRNVEMARTLS
jgi:GNAT superfamily N-acetyltransferase